MIGRSERALRTFVCAVAVVALSGLAHAKTTEPEFVPGEVLVKFRSGVQPAQAQSLLATEGASVVKRYWINGVQRLRVKGDVKQVVASLSRSPLVQYANPNFIVHVLATPNDPSYNQLYGLDNTGQAGGTPDADIDAPEAWDVNTGSSSVLVGVIDTGIDYNHPDLAANVWTNPGEIPGNGIDDDGNGYVDDVHGINAMTGSGDPMDDHEHGTHCSGTIGAVGNNGVGVVGVNWNTKILGCKFLNASGSGSTADATECVQYTTAMGVKLTSNSWGGGGFDQGLGDAIAAADGAGILFIAAAGNSSVDNDGTPNYPSSYTSDNVVAVAATDRNDALASFSSFGATTVDVAAPGVNILSTIPISMGSYGTLSGTSMAAPHVSGLAALIWSQFPSLTQAQVKDRILLTSESKPSLTGKVLTGGRINAYQALTANVGGPHIYYVSPSAGAAGDSVTVAGANLGATQGSSSVTIGGVSAAIGGWSNGGIVATVPNGLPVGPNEVVVTTDDGSSNSAPFTVFVPHYTQSLAPQQFLGGGTAQGWRGDDQCWSYTLPFSFNYFGTDRGSVNVCSNGILDFSAANSGYLNSHSGLKADAMIAPLWDDLMTNGSAQAGEDVYITSSPSSVVIRWAGQTYLDDAPVNVEVVLGQDGSIRFDYGPGNTGLTPTVGISEGGNQRFHFAPHDNAPQLTEALSLLYTPIVTSPCVDQDGDGYGNPGSTACPQGLVLDCDDTNFDVNPGHAEIPNNGLDDDCNPNTPSGCNQPAAEAAVAPGGARPIQLPMDFLMALVPSLAAITLSRRVMKRRSR